MSQAHAVSFGSSGKSFVTRVIWRAIFCFVRDCPCLVYGPVSKDIHAFDERSAWLRYSDHRPHRIVHCQLVWAGKAKLKLQLFLEIFNLCLIDAACAMKGLRLRSDAPGNRR
ncbi:MAG: hypothetical protein Ct9H300mP16_14440 [Pseudomonadota bacterium]|nr:MAG: hypothetical protein Ct9H300mP16_14440 [Pseudomonadota bacterium]